MVGSVGAILGTVVGMISALFISPQPNDNLGGTATGKLESVRATAAARPGIIDLVWNVSQSNKISELNQEVDRLKQSARTSTLADPIQAQLNELRATNSELRLYVAVLFRVLKLKGIIEHDELAKLVEQIDDEDGKRDKAYVGDILP
jgi:hypothetical protein